MSRRVLVIGLIVSVAVNLFLAGAIVGAVVIGKRWREAGPGPPGPLWAAADGLSPARRQAFREALRGEVGGVGGKLRQARVARRAAWMGLNDAAFDPAATTAALDRARALEQAARGEVERRIVVFAADLTPAERAILAEGLARAGPMRGLGRGRRHGPPPPGGPPEG